MTASITQRIRNNRGIKRWVTGGIIRPGAVVGLQAREQANRIAVVLGRNHGQSDIGSTIRRPHDNEKDQQADYLQQVTP